MVDLIAASITVRAIGPAVSCVCEIGTMPVRLIKPTVGLIPTMPLALAGQTIEPFVSVRMPTAGRLADTATPLPELESAAPGFAVLPVSCTREDREAPVISAFELAELTIPELQDRMASGQYTSRQLVAGPGA